MKRTHRRRRRSRLDHVVGAAPGTLDPRVAATHAPPECACWQDGRWERRGTVSAADMEALVASAVPCWVHFDVLPDVAMLQMVQRIFNLHPLAIEDVQHPPRRAKVESYGPVLFATLPAPCAGEHPFEQLSIFLGGRFVLSIGERPGDPCLEQVHRRIVHGLNAPADAAAPALCVAIVDSVIDGYFPRVAEVGDRLDAIEDRILARANADDLHAVRAIKWELHQLRSALWPMRDAVTALIGSDAHFDTERRLVLRSALDHVIRLTDQLDSERLIAGELSDVVLAVVNLRIGEVTRVLTLIATIFIPITFVTSIYGMNFREMPELEWTWGYPAVLLVVASVATGSLLYFRRRGWIGKALLEPSGTTDDSPGN